MGFLGEEGMDIEVNELNPIGSIGKKWKQIVIGVVAILLLIFIFWFAISLSSPKELTIRFTDDKIRVGTSTTLIIEFRNLGNEDLRNVYFRIEPENQGIVLANNEHVETVIGAGAYRKIEIPVSVVGNLTEGTYRISVVVEAGEKEITQNAYLEIVK